jgi:hypothetical protein
VPVPLSLLLVTRRCILLPPAAPTAPPPLLRLSTVPALLLDALLGSGCEKKGPGRREGRDRAALHVGVYPSIPSWCWSVKNVAAVQPEPHATGMPGGSADHDVWLHQYFSRRLPFSPRP